ncbi:hypothetical protein GCM10011504_17010 [Siccirubricoccus deserti]|uniref:Uncharacterized protein n=1 Tax=Siccirubricoccus deserti TaxID=2013562 RepID=A0A9X0QXX1_9PROT|nr:hypothetical protein [Siccirubricoccus deserti]MBC4015920.1 hypothetical protein [Siccirubricoccus deserti]GGC39182.1 hypothetical protein GCM10011504_17010 [Siccirubricoccus deserti]
MLPLLGPLYSTFGRPSPRTPEMLGVPAEALALLLPPMSLACCCNGGAPGPALVPLTGGPLGLEA